MNGSFLSLHRHHLQRLMRALFLRAVLIFVVFAILHILGFRKYTCVISGTASFGIFRTLCGVTYIVFYGLAIACAPVLLLASGLAKGVDLILHAKLGLKVHADK
jgi:hypothetical protein